MKALMILLGMLLIAGSLVGQNANSRYPEGPTVEGPEVGRNQDKKTAKYNWWAARRAFGKRQKKGRGALMEFRRDLEDERMAYHKRVIYQIKQARKLERRYRKRRHASPNFCYPPGKLGLKRNRFR